MPKRRTYAVTLSAQRYCTATIEIKAVSKEDAMAQVDAKLEEIGVAGLDWDDDGIDRGGIRTESVEEV